MKTRKGAFHFLFKLLMPILVNMKGGVSMCLKTKNKVLRAWEYAGRNFHNYFFCTQLTD